MLTTDPHSVAAESARGELASAPQLQEPHSTDEQRSMPLSIDCDKCAKALSIPKSSQEVASHKASQQSCSMSAHRANREVARGEAGDCSGSLTRHGADPVPGPTGYLLPSLGLQFGRCFLCLPHMCARIRAKDRSGHTESTMVPRVSRSTIYTEGRDSHLDSEPPCRSPESRPSNDRVPVPTLVVTVTSLFPTSQVLVLPPARRNSPTGDLREQECPPPACMCRSKGTPNRESQLLKASRTSGAQSSCHLGHRSATEEQADHCPAHPQSCRSSHLLGTAVKLENTYRAIMSRHVSVSSKWRFFKLSSAWAIEFSSADPRLALVRDVCILLEGETMPGLEVRAKGRTMPSHLSPGAKAQCMHGQDGLTQKAHQAQAQWLVELQPHKPCGPRHPRKEGRLEPHGEAPLSGAQLRDLRDRTSLSPKHIGVSHGGSPQLSHADSRDHRRAEQDCILPTGPPPSKDREWLSFMG